MRYRVDITRKTGLSDPEGLTTKKALTDLGYSEVSDVAFGRSIYVDVDTDDPAVATERIDAMCRQLLANPVMEDFSIVPEGAA